MSPPNVKHVVDHVRPWHVVRDHRQVVSLVGARRELNVLAAQHGCGRHAVRGGTYRFSPDNGLRCHAGQRQLEMKNRTGIRLHDQRLFLLLESFQRDRSRVVAAGHGGELKFSTLICFLNLHPVGILRFQRDRGAWNGQVLGSSFHDEG